MRAKRTAGLLVSLLLLGACTTSTGIVDDFVPPQGQPKVESRLGDCAEPSPAPTGATELQDSDGKLVPCLAESIASLAGARPNRPQRDASRPGRLAPSRFPRRGH